MPVLFIGHCPPMNAIEDNEYTRKWSEIASLIPKPKAILSVSAHWYTNGTKIADAEKPRMVYDMYGFPEELYKVRDEGVLILGSGNVVHNLSIVNWDMEGGYPWAYEFDRYIKERFISKRFDDVIGYKNAGKSAESSVRTPDHFYPLLNVLGASRADYHVEVFNEACTMGALSMTCYLFK